MTRCVTDGDAQSRYIAFKSAGDDNLIQGNYVGLNAAGAASIANANYGVIIDNNADRNFVGTNGDGTNDATEGNVIAGNGTNVSVQAAIDNVIGGNMIGVDATGTSAIGGGAGVWITSNASNTRVGSDGDGTSDAIERNIISGHSGNGITIDGGANNNAVAGNYIGTDAAGTGSLGNGVAGVRIATNSASNVIGGVAVGQGNTIAFNADTGIRLTPTANNATILGNSIHSNFGLGIDLGNSGVTANDLSDADSVQNFPDLVSAASSGGNTTILGTLNSTASTTFDLHFYSTSVADSSGFGEGAVYLGTDLVSTDGSGNAVVNTTLTGVSVTLGHVITATATDPGGNTSEFSIAVSVAAPNPVLDLDTDDSSGQALADFAVAWTEDGPPVNIADGDATLFDPDSTTLSSLTVAITNQLDGAAEILTASTGGTSISASYDSMTGVLSLTGVDTIANYQQVLRSVTYDNMLQDPNTTARTVTFVANDGANDSNLATTTITLNDTNDAPQLDLDADNSSGQTGADLANTFTEDAGPVRIADTDAILVDVDNATLTSLQVVLTNQFDGADEVLAADTTGTSITATYNAGVLTLSGVDSVANYEQTLRTITYENTSQNPDATTRIIEFLADDGLLPSNLATAFVAITPQNDAPVATGESYTVDNDKTLTVGAPGILANDSDVDMDPLSVTVVSLPGSGTLNQNADGSFTYTPDLNFSGTTSFTYLANDGTTGSTLATVSIEVITTSAPPTDPDPEPPPTDDPDEEEEADSPSDDEDSTTPDEPDAGDDSDANDDSSTPGAPVGNVEQSSPEPTPPEEAFAVSNDEEAARDLVVAETFRAGSAKTGYRLDVTRNINLSPQRFGSVDLAASFLDFEQFQQQRGLLWEQLDTLQEQVESNNEREFHIAGTATVMTAAISTGYVIWALRGSFLLASFLSTLPAWRTLDPLPILEGNQGVGGPDDDESLVDIASSSSKPHPEESADTKSAESTPAE